ncbi:MAG: [FeFe] hydrogenase, group A [Bacteroidota bacterium]|nr:[FeFe] hydrogenase, group A [Bacteroidota bacterium]
MENNNFINIDGIDIPIENEKNVLELIRKADIDLPTFCYHSELSVYGACRLCVVEVEGMGVQASCSLPPRPNMKIKTMTEEIRRIRKVNLELLLANHDISCPTCSRSNNCKLQDLSRRLGIEKSRFKKTTKEMPLDNSSYSIIHDPNKCVLCGDCVRVCKEIQSIGAIDFIHRGAECSVGTAFGKGLANVECVNCGQCVSVCPVGALTPKPETEEVWKDIHNKEKIVVAQIAPAVRVAIGEMFGLEAGELTTGQIVASLKKLGFDYVYDTSFGADLTVFEEATEFIQRKLKGERLPQFTSCCPGWVKFAEQYYSELLPNLSSCKSPQQMFGSVAKRILPDLLGVKAENISVVSIMPCTAKKFEAKRPEFYNNQIADVDHVLTTEALARMIGEAGIRFRTLTPQSFDLPLGFKTGAAVIFGTSGGVSEAVLRFAYEKLTGEVLHDCDFKVLRGNKEFREIAVKIGELELKIGIAYGLKNAREFCEKVKSGNTEYDLIEVMACPGGCIAGGGQPVSFDPDFKAKRTKGLYNADKQLQLHKSQENPYIKELYNKVLGEPGSHIAHELLHTDYSGRKRIEESPLNIRNTNHPKIEVSVCVGTNCFIKGSQQILKEIMNYVVENRLQDIVGFEGLDKHDEMVDVQATFCFEKCNRGPVVKVNNIVVEHADFKKVKTVLDKEIKRIVSLLNN